MAHITTGAGRITNGWPEARRSSTTFSLYSRKTFNLG
jgi:hypothetical protein